MATSRGLIGIRPLLFDRLEAFASFYGADFYGLPRNTESVTLVKESWDVPAEMKFGGDVLVPLRAGERIGWRMLD